MDLESSQEGKSDHGLTEADGSGVMGRRAVLCRLSHAIEMCDLKCVLKIVCLNCVS